MRARIGFGLIAALVGVPFRLAAQCPDGSPPPCGSARGTTAAPPPRSVAVLYFESLSRDTADAYIADGFTEEITASLGQIERLSVTARTAARRLRNVASLSTSDLGRVLNARYLVSGTVRRSETRLRVTVELVQAATGSRVWGDQYDRSADDLLSIEAEVARAVASGIAGQLLPAEVARLAARPTPNAGAYDHYLRGNRFLWRQDERSVLAAITEYETALALDSSFTKARGRLANAYGIALNWSYGMRGMPRDTVRVRGLVAADRAIREDSTVADAWLGRALMLFLNGGRDDVARAVESGQRAVSLDPKDDGMRQQYGTLLRRAGRFAESEQQYRIARAMNPQQVQSTADLGFLAYSQRRYADAVQWYDSAVALDTSFSAGFTIRSRARAGAGDLAGALSDARRALRLAVSSERPRLLAETAEMEWRNGLMDSARIHLQQAFTEFGWPNGVPPGPVPVRNVYDAAQAAVVLGMPDVALAILEQATPRGPWLWSYLIFPGFDSLRSDPRFMKIFEESKPPGAPEIPQ